MTKNQEKKDCRLTIPRPAGAVRIKCGMAENRERCGGCLGNGAGSVVRFILPLLHLHSTFRSHQSHDAKRIRTIHYQSHRPKRIALDQEATPRVKAATDVSIGQYVLYHN